MDREKVIKGLEQFKADLKPFCGNRADWERFDAGLALLKEQPEIVRCKDCQEWKRETIEHVLCEFGEEDTAECERMCRIDSWGELHDEDRRTGENWFCADGKRWSAQ
jgi:hypothetical protein